MAIILILFLVISITSLHFCTKQEQKMIKEQAKGQKIKKKNPMRIWMIAVTALAALMVVSIIAVSTQCKENSEVVAEFQVSNDNYMSLFYDDVKDEYFIYDTNWWNPIKMFERKIVEKEKAEKIINAVETIRKEAEYLLD